MLGAGSAPAGLAGDGRATAAPQAEPSEQALRADLEKIRRRIVQIRDAVIPANRGRSGRAVREVFVDGKLSESRLAGYILEINALAGLFREYTGKPVKLRVRRGGTHAEIVASMIQVLKKLHWIRRPLVPSRELSAIRRMEIRFDAETARSDSARAAFMRRLLAGGYQEWSNDLTDPSYGNAPYVGAVLEIYAQVFYASISRAVWTAPHKGPVREARLFLLPLQKYHLPSGQPAGDPQGYQGGPFIEHQIRVKTDVRRPEPFGPRELMTGGFGTGNQPGYREVPLHPWRDPRLCDLSYVTCRANPLVAVLEELFGLPRPEPGPVTLQASGTLYFTFIGFEELEKLRLWSQDRTTGRAVLTGDVNQVLLNEEALLGKDAPPPAPGETVHRNFVLIRVV